MIRVPNALAALVRKVSLEVSARDLANVRCSCGRNGFKNVGIFSSRLFSVRRIAAIPRLGARQRQSGDRILTFDIHRAFGHDTNEWTGDLRDEML